MHGFLVGLLVAIVVLTLGGRPFDLARLSEAVLTLAAGWLGGRLGSRR